jgi:hypothetical protein
VEYFARLSMVATILMNAISERQRHRGRQIAVAHIRAPKGKCCAPLSSLARARELVLGSTRHR